MLNIRSRNHYLSLSIVLVLVACGDADHSGRYVGTETMSQNGISQTNQVTLDLTQNQSTINGTYSALNSSGTLVGTVNSSDPNRIESINLTLSSRDNYVPPHLQYGNPGFLGSQQPFHNNNQQPNINQMNQAAYSYQQQLGAQNNPYTNPAYPQNGLYGVPSSYGVNCSGTYTGELLANEKRDRLVGNLSLGSSDICGQILRMIDLRKTEQ